MNMKKIKEAIKIILGIFMLVDVITIILMIPFGSPFFEITFYITLSLCLIGLPIGVIREYKQ